MGTTAEKLTYLSTTKNYIKESINLTNINITNEPFRYYAYAIKKGIINVLNDPKEIWNNFENVTGEGTSIELTSTENAPIEINLKGNLSQSGEPTPDNPVDIHIVSGDNTIEICGKNLFNIPNNTGTKGHNTFVASNQEITINSDSSGTESAFYLNDVSQTSVYAASNYSTARDYKMTSMGGTYTLTTYFSYKPQNTTQIYLFTNKRGIMKNVTIDWQNGKLTHNITLEDDEYIKSIQCYCAVTNVYNNLKITAQLEKGTTATDYVPHQEYTKEINLGELEVGSIGEYEDEFFKNTTDSEYYDSTLELDKWYLKKRIGKVVLDGSETWTYELVNNLDIFKYNNTNMLKGNVLGGYCNYYYNTNGTSTFKDGVIRFGWGNNYLYFMNDTSRFSGTISNFTTWLSTHNTIVYYVLATPTNIEITDSTLIYQLEKTLYSYSGLTNISQTNNDLPFILDVKALKLIE